MKSETEGWGFNRVGRGPLVTVFPFKTSLGQSVIDGGPCVIIDYNVPRNPWWERLTYDELREVAAGVFLGITTLRFSVEGRWSSGLLWTPLFLRIGLPREKRISGLGAFVLGISARQIAIFESGGIAALGPRDSLQVPLKRISFHSSP